MNTFAGKGYAKSAVHAVTGDARMKRRLMRMVMMGVALPLAARTAVAAADHLEATKGSTRMTRSLRRAGIIANRR
jgi:hypothetical protein